MFMEGGSRPGAGALSPPPLLSVITVAFGDRAEVEALLRNISAFRCRELEFLVIDGGSVDGTRELLEANDHLVDYWISEPDAGIYDAMNKGVRAARGTYLLHINAGDRLRSVPWEELRECAAAEIDVVCCRVLVDRLHEFVSRTSLLSRMDNTWHHQGTFYLRSSHLGYDTGYRVYGDFEHNQRLLKAGCSSRQYSKLVAEHLNNGVSMGKGARGEIYRSVRQHFGRRYLAMAALRFAIAPAWLWVKQRYRREGVAR